MPDSLFDYYCRVLDVCRRMRGAHTFSFITSIVCGVLTVAALYKRTELDSFYIIPVIPAIPAVICFVAYRYTKPFKKIFYACLNQSDIAFITPNQDSMVGDVCLPGMAYSSLGKKEITNEMYCDLEEYINNMPNDQIERHVFEEIRGYASTLMQMQGCILYKDLGRILIHIERKKTWIIHNNECEQASEIKDSLLNNDRTNTSAEPENRIDERAPKKFKGWRKIDF